MQVNWMHVAILGLTPLAAIAAPFFVPLQRQTLLFAVFYYFFTGMGITAGKEKKHS